MIVRFYDASKNEDGAFFPGVPLADIGDATWEALPQWLQDSVDASLFYRKTPARNLARDEASPPKERKP